jgi:hypothetical protein
MSVAIPRYQLRLLGQKDGLTTTESRAIPRSRAKCPSPRSIRLSPAEFSYASSLDMRTVWHVAPPAVDIDGLHKSLGTTRTPPQGADGRR